MVRFLGRGEARRALREAELSSRLKEQSYMNPVRKFLSTPSDESGLSKAKGAASPGAELRLSERRGGFQKKQSRPPPRVSCLLSSTSARRERAQQTRYAVM